MPANAPRVEGIHYWITKRSLPGVVLCKWCGHTQGPRIKALACQGPIDAAIPQDDDEDVDHGPRPDGGTASPLRGPYDERGSVP